MNRTEGSTIHGISMMREKARLYICLSLSLAALLMAAAIIGCSKSGSTDVIAWVEGEPIETAEFKHLMLEERSQVHQYFHDKYGATDEEGFWEKGFDGEKPIDKLKADAWRRLVRRKIEQIIALREGVIKSTAYSALEKELEIVNQERQAAVARKEPVFGPVQYDLRTYYRLSHRDMTQAVKNKWLADSSPTEQELSELYDELKDVHFQNPIEARVEYIRIPVEQENDVRILQRLLAVLQQGGSWAQATSECNTEHAGKLECGQRTFNRASLTEDLMSYPSVLRELGSLRTGETSDVISERLYHYVIRVLDKKATSYRPKEEVMENLKRLFVDRVYDARVHEMESKAEVRMNERVYRSTNLMTILQEGIS